MLKIKLIRYGKKKKPYYKIIVLEKLFKNYKKNSSIIGSYNPLIKSLHIDKIKLKKALTFGSYPTDIVRHLIYKNYSI